MIRTNIIFLLVCVTFVVNSREALRKKFKHHHGFSTSTSPKIRHNSEKLQNISEENGKQLQANEHRLSISPLFKKGHHHNRRMAKRRITMKRSPNATKPPAVNFVRLTYIEVTFELAVESAVCPSNHTMQCPGCDITCYDINTTCPAPSTSCEVREQACDCDYNNNYVREYYAAEKYRCILKNDCKKIMPCWEHESIVCPNDNCTDVTLYNLNSGKPKYQCPKATVDIRKCSKPPQCHCHKAYIRQDMKEGWDDANKCITLSQWCAASFPNTTTVGYCISPRCKYQCKKNQATLPSCPKDGDGLGFEACWDGSLKDASYTCGCPDGKIRHYTGSGDKYICLSEKECEDVIESLGEIIGREEERNKLLA